MGWENIPAVNKNTNLENTEDRNFYSTCQPKVLLKYVTHNTEYRFDDNKGYCEETFISCKNMHLKR